MRIRSILTMVLLAGGMALSPLAVAKDGDRGGGGGGRSGGGGGGARESRGGGGDRGGGGNWQGGGRSGGSRDSGNARSGSGNRDSRSYAKPSTRSTRESTPRSTTREFSNRSGDSQRKSSDAARSTQRSTRDAVERRSDREPSFVREYTRDRDDRSGKDRPQGTRDVDRDKRYVDRDDNNRDKRYVDRDDRYDGRYTTGYRGDFKRDGRYDDRDDRYRYSRGEFRRNWDDDRNWSRYHEWDRDWDRDRYAHRHDHNYWRSRSYFFGIGSPFGRYLAYPWWYTGFGQRFGYFPNYGYGYRDWGRPGYYAYDPNYAYAPGGYYDDSGYVTQRQIVDPPPAPSQEKLQSSLDFAGQGELAFKEGRYADAAKLWRHALVDDPTNGAIVLLLSQALFQLGDWDEAAGSIQQACRMLPEERWGTVVQNHEKLYASVQDYTEQLKVLERARDDDLENPGIRFLLGYHFGFLGYPKQAVRELDKALELAPKDEVAQRLRDMFADKLGAQAGRSRTQY